MESQLLEARIQALEERLALISVNAGGREDEADAEVLREILESSGYAMDELHAMFASSRDVDWAVADTSEGYSAADERQPFAEEDPELGGMEIPEEAFHRDWGEEEGVSGADGAARDLAVQEGSIVKTPGQEVKVQPVVGEVAEGRVGGIGEGEGPEWFTSRFRQLSRDLRGGKESAAAANTPVRDLAETLVGLGPQKVPSLVAMLLLANCATEGCEIPRTDLACVGTDAVAIRRSTLRVLAVALEAWDDVSEMLATSLADSLLSLLPSLLTYPRAVVWECGTLLKVVCLRAGTNKVDALVGALVSALGEATERLTPEAVSNVVELVGGLVLSASQQQQTHKHPPLSEIGTPYVPEGHRWIFARTDVCSVSAHADLHSRCLQTPICAWYLHTLPCV